ncbi:MAG: hypothetical protein ACTSPY_06830 [Candidatus Helarchaeota archaeon]
MEKKQYSESISNCDHEPILDEIKGDYICSKCGLVLERYYVMSRYQLNESFNNPTSNSPRFVALGDRPNLVDGLGSYIGFQHSTNFMDKNGNKLSPNKQILFRRLKYRYDLRSKINNNETNYRVLNILNRIVNRLNLSNNVRDRAAYYYKRITKEVDKSIITNHIILISLCIFIAVREYNKNAPITIQELANRFKELNYRVSAKSIIREAMKLKPHIGDLFTHHTRKSEDYIDRLVSSIINSDIVLDRLNSYKINIDDYRIHLKTKSNELLDLIKFNKRGGRNPFIFAVAIIYTVDQINRKKNKGKTILTQKILAEITNCAEYSIRDHYRFIKTQFLNNL